MGVFQREHDELFSNVVNVKIHVPCFNCLLVDLFVFVLLQLFTVDFPQKKSWQAAREDCLARGADLVSIHNPAEEIFLSSYSKGKTKWIGLSVSLVEGGLFAYC